VILAVKALVSFVVLLVAVRAGASDPEFQVGSADSMPIDDDDENRAA
jgi:hypothetical protein